MDREEFARWIAAYERAWRSAGTEQLAELFDPDATYLMAPYDEPHRGLEAIAKLWDRERVGPDEEFEIDSEILAVEGDTAVARIEVRYAELDEGRRTAEEYRDIWIARFGPDGRCVAFEEWPFAPGGQVGISAMA